MAAVDPIHVAAGKADGASADSPRTAPEVVAPSNRVNVALPFAKITVQEPTRDLTELVAIVAELVTIVEDIAPGPATKKLHTRARALAAAMT